MRTWWLVLQMLLASLCGIFAYADDWLSSVHIQWKEALNAKRYQVQINEDPSFQGRHALDLNIEGTQLTTQLSVGKYYMRVRHLDLFGKVSKWSDFYEVMVKPPAPTPVTPTQKAEITTPNLISNFYLRWKPITGCKEYQIHVYRDAREIYRARTPKQEYPLQKMESGKYSWNVGCVFSQKSYDRSSGRAIASEKEYEGDRSDPNYFSLNVKENKTIPTGPKLHSPKGLVLLRPEPVLFSWDPMPSQEKLAYHFHLYRKEEIEDSDGKVTTHWEHLVSKRDVPSRYNRYLASKLSPGKYKWEVEAERPDPNSPEVVARTEQEFRISTPNEERQGSGFLSLGGSIAAMNYQSRTPQYSTEFAIQLNGPVAHGEFWFTKFLGVDLSYLHQFGVFKDTAIAYREAAGGLHYRYSFFQNFVADIRMGFGWYSMPELIAVNTIKTEMGVVTRLSLLPTAKLAYWFDDRSQVYAAFMYNHLLKLSGGTTTSSQLLAKQIINYRISLGARSFLFFPWGFGAEGARLLEGYVHTTKEGEFTVKMPQWEFRVFLMYGF